MSEGKSTPGAPVTAVPWGNSFALFIADPSGGIYAIKAEPGFGWELVPGRSTTPGARITAVPSGNRFKLFMADVNGEIFTTSGIPYQGWDSWTSVSEGSSTPGAPVAAVPFGQSFALFIADPGGEIYALNAQPGFGWELVPGRSTRPGAQVTAVPSGNRFTLFMADANGEIFTTSGIPYQGWDPWTSVSEGKSTPGAPVAAVPFGQGFALFIADPGGGIYAINAQPGFGWELVPGHSTKPGAQVTAMPWNNPISPERFLLFMADVDGTIYMTSGIPYQGWDPWTNVSKGISTPGAPVAAVPWGQDFALFFADLNGLIRKTSSFAPGDVPTYHVDSRRTGLNANFPFGRGGGPWTRYTALPTRAVIRAAPLYLSQYHFTAGPHASETHDVVIVASSDNTVYAYAEDELLAGGLNALWVQQSLGMPGQRQGNVGMPGIASTPVIDRSSATIYVVAYVSDSSGEAFRVVALDLNTGTIRNQAKLNDPGGSGRPTFNPTLQDQRGGLNLVNGWIYATFADYGADESGAIAYHGWVVGCNHLNLSQQLFLPITKVVGGGMWGAGGAAAALDGTLYLSTGNAGGIAPVGNNPDPTGYWKALGGKHPGDIGDFFEAVVRVQRSATGLHVVGWYQPTWAKTLNDGDLDLGGSSPLVLPPIEGRNLVITTGKDGRIYLLDATLGGWGAELYSDIFTGPGFDGSEGGSKCAAAYYHDPTSGGDFVYVVCLGTPGLTAYRVEVSGSPRLAKAWQSQIGFAGLPGSPFVTADPERKEAIVWVAGATPDRVSNKLYGLDAVSGQLVFQSDEIGPAFSLQPVVGAGRSIFVGTTTGVVGYTEIAGTSLKVSDSRS
ncbi:MAG: hypothetical protein ACR2I2_04845 [Bryobacteraceae bacterium]